MQRTIRSGEEGKIVIATSQQPEVKQTTPPSSYKVAVPATNPLMPSAAVSLVKEGKDISLSWEVTAPSETEGVIEKLATESLTRALETVGRFPSSSRAYTNLGVAHSNAGAMSEATSAFEKALELDPNNYVAGINLAKVFIEVGKYEEAEKIYRRLNQSFAKNVTPLMSLAYLAMRQSRFEEAERLFREVISRRPATPVPFYHLAVLLLRKTEANEAIRHLRTALRHNVRSADLYQALGVAFALAGQNERSLRSFKTALTLSPNLSSAVKGSANTLLKAGQVDTVIELLSAHLDREPRDWEARRILAGAYLSRERYSSARAQLMQVLESLPPDDKKAERSSELSNDIGFTYFREQKLKEAEDWFTRSIRDSSSHGTLPYRNLTHLYSLQERYQEALDVLQKCADIFGDDEYVIVARSYVHAQLGDYERAISDLERLLSKGTDNRQAYGMLSGFLADVKHDYERALTILEEAYPKFSEDDWLINNLAYVHLMLGHTQAARVLLERKAISSKTKMDVALMATHGLLYLREGDLAKACEFYKSSATLASQLGHKDLAGVVRQKMHLELACEALRKRDTVTALHEVNLGLGVSKGSPNYRNDLVLLKQKLA
jgi:tetratricopeptide (TPR) repeat protein